MKKITNLAGVFLAPANPTHRRYEALRAFFVEGLVHSSRLPGRFELDERAHALVLRGSRRRLRLGDRLHVRIDRDRPPPARLPWHRRR